jgi:putative hydrolase
LTEEPNTGIVLTRKSYCSKKAEEKSMMIEADLHIHTVASGHAYSTINEIALEAARKGLSMVALTDHGPALPGGAHPYHFWNQKVIPDVLHGVHVLRGIEANITDEKATLDMPDDYLELLDIVLVGFHPSCGYESVSKAHNTAVLIKAMENKFTDIIVHPGNAKFPIEPKPLVDAAKELGVAIELNNSSFLPSSSRQSAYDFDYEIAKHIAETGAYAVLSSDAHIYMQVGEVDKSVELAKKTGIKKAQILNLSTPSVLEYLKKRRESR